MDYKLLKYLTVKHIKLAIDLMENPDKYDFADISYFQSLDEQIFISLSFIGALLERTDNKIFKNKIALGYKYLWNYSKHGKSTFTFVKINKNPTFTFPLEFGDKNFTFGSGFYAWKNMPFDGDKRNKKQFEAYNDVLRGKHIPNTFREFLNHLEEYKENKKTTQ